MNTNMTGFKCFSEILRPWLDKSSLSIGRVKKYVRVANLCPCLVHVVIWSIST